MPPVTKNYDYDAFGNECDPDEEDTNPFRYCAEYFGYESLILISQYRAPCNFAENHLSGNVS